MKKPIKICMVSSVHFALDTRIFYRLALSLSTQYQVTVIGVHPTAQTKMGIQIVPFKRFKNKMIRISITWLLMFFKCLKQNASLYHIHDPELMPTALLLRFIGKKVVYDVHENIAADIWDKPWIKQKKIPILVTEQSYLPRYHKLNAQVTLVQNFPNNTFFQPYYVTQRQHKPIRLFYIGILLFSRSIMQIIEAMHLLQQKQLFVHLDVVGELYTDMDNAIDSLPYIKEIKPYLHFYGRLPLEQGYKISQNASIGLSLIHKMANSEWSYPTKMFEYMCIGLPQIASNFTLYEQVVKTHNCGLTADAQNPASIAAAIETYATNAHLWQTHASNAYTASLNYHWQSQMEKVHKVYNQLLV